MSHFAKVDKTTNMVTDVIVATQLEVYGFPDSEDWFQTSYNESDGKPYAQAGGTYDKSNNLFIPPQPTMSVGGVACTSWTWNSSSYEWEPPVAKPSDYKEDDPDKKLYAWVEETREWVEHYSAEDVENGSVPDSYKVRVGISTT